MRRYAISNSALLGGVERLPEWVAWLDEQGVDLVQIREKHLTARELIRVVALCVARARRIRVLVNLRADVALSCGAHGVHLPSASFAPACLRRIVGDDFLIGVSCHSQHDCEVAQREGADFAVISPVFSPLSKVDATPPLGLDGLSLICRAVTLPLYALGGIEPSNANACVESGATGVAGITLFLPRR